MWYQEILAEILVTLIIPVAVWILSKLRRREPRFVLKTLVIINILLQTFFLIKLPERLKYTDQFTIRAVIVFIILVAASYAVAFKKDPIVGLKKMIKQEEKIPKKAKRIRRRKYPKIHRSRKSRRRKKEAWY